MIYDLLLNAAWQLVPTRTGDLALTDRALTPQRIKLLLLCQPGEIRHRPLAGVHLHRYLNGQADDLPTRIDLQLRADGLSPLTVRAIVDRLSMTLNVNADLALISTLPSID